MTDSARTAGIALHEGNIAEMGTGEAWPRAVWADVLFDSAAAAKSTSRAPFDSLAKWDVWVLSNSCRPDDV